MFHKQGFTLIEILVIILIVAIVSALVAPVAYNSVKKFDNLIKISKKADISKYVGYLSFITDSKCKYDNNTITCGHIKYNVK